MGNGISKSSKSSKPGLASMLADAAHVLLRSDAKLLASGLPGTAAVLRVWDTGTTVNEDPMLGLLLRVSPADGTPPFEAVTKCVVSRLQVAYVTPGAGCEVAYDPETRTKVAVRSFTSPGGSLGGNFGGFAGGEATREMFADDKEAAAAALRTIEARNKQVRASGVQAPARVLSFRTTGISVNGGNPWSTMLMEVFPPGGATFVASSQGAFGKEVLAKFVPGKWVTAACDGEGGAVVVKSGWEGELPKAALAA
ncbi:hypothetical protein DFJ74DRAFT_710411 [Hyaloraphidium curvatum]|nr:hypothetical protein DFJ74DRAFT_710411 [Hyaloraphidium curvatum]